MTSIKTQKAMGIMHGIRTLLDDYSTMGIFIGEVGYQLIRVEENIDVAYIQYPCFARPCPKTPRHGFVESRVVKSAKDLHKLWKEVKAQDVDGEIVVGPFIKDANYNAVYVSSGILSVGPGHDGATSGKKSVSFPVAPHRYGSGFLDLVRIKKSDAVYLESVSNRKAGWHLTQVRGGPHLRGGKKDYVPEPVKVKKVVLPSTDLLEWEQKVKTLERGSVVYGLGHTLASHAAVHCILHKVPFVTSFKPEVGASLKPTERASSANKYKLDRSQFKRGVKAALDTNYKNPVKHLGFALAVLHNWAYLRKSEGADVMLGAAVTTFVKIGTALCLGEWRHGSGGPKGGREGIYKKVMNNGLTYLYKTPDAFKNFYQDNWTEGFGGLSWANCAWYAYEMWKQVIQIYNAKRATVSDREVALLIDKMNRAITMAHNNGWWFNKITDESLMDLAADQPGLLAFCLADMFVSIKNRANKIKSVKKNLAKLSTIKPPFAKDHKGNVIWAYIGIDVEECYDECCFDNEATITIQSGGDDGDYTTRYVNLSKKEFSLVKRAASKYASNRAYLKAVPRKGFKMPGGRLIKYKHVVSA